MNWFRINVSTYGAEIDQLFWLIFVYVAVAFVISLFALVFPLVKYHHSRAKAAQYVKGSGWKQLKWIVIPLVVLTLSDFTILMKEHGTWAKTQAAPPTNDFHVAVVGRQWNWIFVYPGLDGKLNTPDDITVDRQNSELHVPVNKNVQIDIKAKDVLHSFFVPDMRFKYDAIPGRTIVRWFNATQQGKYEIFCAEICGLMHSKMRNFVVVESEENFGRFLAELHKEQEQKLQAANN